MKPFQKLLGWGTLALAIAILPSTTHAFNFRHMTQDQYEELKTLVEQHNQVDTFLEAVKTKKEARQSERKAMKESLTHDTQKIDNGIIKTITSDNADVVAKLHAKENKSPKREGITKTVEKLSNGLKITITTDDSELVEKLQNRTSRRGQGRKFNRRRTRVKKPPTRYGGFWRIDQSIRSTAHALYFSHLQSVIRMRRRNTPRRLSQVLEKSSCL